MSMAITTLFRILGFHILFGFKYVQNNKDLLKDYRYAEEQARMYKTGNLLYPVEPQYLSYLKSNRTQYMQMVIATDKGMWEYYKNESLLTQSVLKTINQLDKSFQAINVRLVVVGFDIHKEDKWNRTGLDSGGDRNGHIKYANSHYQQMFKGVTDNVDQLVAVFLSSYGWGNVIGRATGESVCWKAKFTALWSKSNFHGPTGMIGHELTHAFLSSKHDWEYDWPCPCLSPRGCFLRNPYKMTRAGFSTCNMDKFSQKTFDCLAQPPKHPYQSICGNGILEKGEICDCGTPEMCAANGDKCCEPYNCVLKKQLQCNPMTNPDCCDATCHFKTPDTVCRNATEECDIAEYCTGDQPQCPKDDKRKNGMKCTDNGNVCYNGGCVQGDLSTQCEDLWNSAWTLVQKDVCFESKGNMYGQITLRNDATLSNMRLVYRSGGITCKDTLSHARFGCNGKDYYSAEHLSVFVTDSANKLVFPQGISQYNGFYSLTPYNANSEDVILTGKATFTKGTVLRLWYGEDLYKSSYEGNNEGKVCVDVFTKLEGAQGAISADDICWNKYNTNDEGFGTCSIEQKTPCLIKNAKCGQLQCNAHNKPALVRDFVHKHVHEGNSVCSLMNVIGNNKSAQAMVNDGTVCGQNMVCVNQECKEVKKCPLGSNGLECSGKGICTLLGGCDCQVDYNVNEKCEKAWTPIQRDVCFEGKGDAYGQITIPISVTLDSLRLVYQSGGITCNSKFPLSKFGCNGKSYYTLDKLAVIVSDSNNKLVFPNGISHKNGFYSLPPYTAYSEDVILPGSVTVEKGTVLRLWYGEDRYKSSYESNNKGRVCVDVYSKLDAFLPIDGQWSKWSSFGECDRACSGGSQSRHRYCNNPYPKFGGNTCQGNGFQTVRCNVDACPVAGSCFTLQKKMLEKGVKPKDGIYTITTLENDVIPVYCDMTHRGGGWTLIVSSHTNNWTKESVKSKNEEKPYLFDDYSILRHANLFKGDNTSSFQRFEYKLECNQRGRYGALFSSPAYHDLSPTIPQRKGLILVENFDHIRIGRGGLRITIPYLIGARLTTNDPSDTFGSITNNDIDRYPTAWITGAKGANLEDPEHIWYWVREVEFRPQSCLELLKRAKENVISKVGSGKHTIWTEDGLPIKTYCDFNRYAGGWTLAANIISDNWTTTEKAEWHLTENVLTEDFSILRLLKTMKIDPAEKYYQLMIEADGVSANGGIFGISTQQGLCSGAKPTLLRKFGDWNQSEENISQFTLCVNRTSTHGGVIYANSGVLGDEFGILAGKGKYMKQLENPKQIKIWFREQGSRNSCNDIRLHGSSAAINSYKDGVYLLRNDMFVYCDMTTTPGQGWTLIVTSTTTGWTKEMMLSRNAGTPSLTDNYSILDKADTIKQLSGGETFRYMIDAEFRGQYGGIWSASTFENVLRYERGVPSSLEVRFSKWINHHIKDGLNDNLPYIHASSTTAYLRTTKAYDWYFGTICSQKAAPGAKSQQNTRYLFGEMISPKAIWYWINENDCSPQLNKVDGKLSEWSEWSPCSKFCGDGETKRVRRCVKPRCGGKECDDLNLQETKPCQGDCTATKILTRDLKFCLEPEKGGCSTLTETKIVLRSTTTHCQTEISNFAFDQTAGVLWHKCSGKPVCTHKANYNSLIRVKTEATCGQMHSIFYKFQRSIVNTLQAKYYCLTPVEYKTGSRLHLTGGPECYAPGMSSFIMPNLDHGGVNVELYDKLASRSLNGLQTDSRYIAKTPTWSGVISNFDLFYYRHADGWGARMTTYFTAFQTGPHRFNLAANDMASLRFSEKPGDIGVAKEIISLTSATKRYEYRKYIAMQYSEPTDLQSGHTYYLEVLVVNDVKYFSASVRVQLPDLTYQDLAGQMLSKNYA